MKFVQTRLVFALSAMSAFAQAQQSPSILGKTDVHALLEAAPGVPNTPAEAAKRAQQSGDIFPSFYQRTTEAHELIKQGAAARAKGMPDQVTLEAQAKAQLWPSPPMAHSQAALRGNCSRFAAGNRFHPPSCTVTT